MQYAEICFSKVSGQLDQAKHTKSLQINHWLLGVEISLGTYFEW